jgi:chromosome segregation ATPase
MTRAQLALVLLLSAATVAPATATPLEDRLREQLQATTTQLRDLQAGQATAEAAKAAAEKERDALKAKLGSGGPDASRELASAKSQNAALRSQVESTKSELAAASSRAADTSARLASAEAELAQLRSKVGASTAAAASSAASLKSCLDANGRLVDTGRELVALHQKRYGHGTFPPLQLLRTQIENEAQAMGDKITGNAIIPNAAGGAPK